MSKRILIIEDDITLSKNLTNLLSQSGYNVIGVSTAEEFYKVASVELFDVAIVDIGLPDKNDFEITEYLGRTTDTYTIILTARETVDDKVKGYGAGADIYLVKPVETSELIAVIENSSHKNTELNRNVENNDAWVFQAANWTLVAPNGKKLNLTSMENALIEAVLENPGSTTSRAAILKRLGYSSLNSEDNNALNVLLARLRKKSKLTTDKELPIKTVRNLGYTFSEPVELV